MDKITAEHMVKLIEEIRDLSFDVNFCLEILKQDEEIAHFYDRCKKRFDESVEKAKKEMT